MTEFACLPAAELSSEDVLLVRNTTNGEVACSGVTNDELGHFRVSVPSDADDRFRVELYRGARVRQTPEFRRLTMLAQIGLESGDPVNYVGRVFLDPVVTPDAPAVPHNILVTHTDGDPNVVISTGYNMARVAGVLPFLPPDAPPHLANFRPPASFRTAYPGFDSPNDVLIANHAIEALPRLMRHPVTGGAPTALTSRT